MKVWLSPQLFWSSLSGKGKHFPHLHYKGKSLKQASLEDEKKVGYLQVYACLAQALCCWLSLEARYKGSIQMDFSFHYSYTLSTLSAFHLTQLCEMTGELKTVISGSGKVTLNCCKSSKVIQVCISLRFDYIWL